MADDIVKVIADTRTDAASLQVVVNGDEDTQVTTRLGESYPSIKKAIKTMFENGGLPATPFATKALMIASSLPNGAYAVVMEDAPANNGYYVKTSGTWVFSKYNITELIKGRISISASTVTHNIDVLSAEMPYIEINGTLTADITVNLPTLTHAKSWVVLNNTGGAFSVIFKQANILVVKAKGTSLMYSRGSHLFAGFPNKAELDSPNFYGTPKAPNADRGTATSQIATTAFVAQAVGDIDVLSQLSTINSKNINSGKSYPLLALTRNSKTSNAKAELNDVLLDAKVYGAKAGKYYRVDIIANGSTSSMSASGWQISEHDIANYSTTHNFGKYVVSKEVPQQALQKAGLQSITLYSTDKTLRFEFVVDTSKLPASGTFIRSLNETDDGYSWVIDPVNYDYQNLIISDVSEITIYKTDSVKRYWYEQATAQAQSQINAQRIYSNEAAPLPLQHTPQQYDVPNTIVDAVKFSEGAKIGLETFYVEENGHVVHPYALEFWDKFAGHKHWLGITPYQNRSGGVENPFIYVSDDLQTFKYLETVQPLADLPPKPTGAFMTYNSDVFFVYDHFAGELLCCWRYSNHPSSSTTTTVENGLYARATKDGKTWSTPKVIYPISTGDLLLSPSIIYDFVGKKWMMYYVSTDPSDTTNKVTLRTTKTLGAAWSNPTYIANQNGVLPWHLEVKYIGKRLGMLIHDNTNEQLHFAISDDGLVWQVGGGIIQGAFNGVYKSSFTTVFNDSNQMSVRIFWTTFNKTAVSNDPDDMQLHINQSDFINLILE